MGRVSKYKKIKSCDPYSKKNNGRIDLSTVGIWGLGDSGQKVKKRSRTAQRLKAMGKKKKHQNEISGNDGFDLPPDAEDEFDMSDLLGSVKKQKVMEYANNGDTFPTIATTKKVQQQQKQEEESYDQVVTSTGIVANIPKTNDDEMKVTRLLKLDQQVKNKHEEKKLQNQKRMDGESKREYAKRTKIETRQIIKQTTSRNKNLEKLQRKKEFLQNKKKNKKGGRSSLQLYDDYDDDEFSSFSGRRDTLITGERAIAALAADPVQFGEQAERPPVFRQLPRGATKSKTNHNGSNQQKKTQKFSGMSEEQIEAEKDVMEQMRRKVQAQYAMVKSKRRQAGEFHL